MSEIPITDLTRIALEPGDKLLVRLPNRIIGTEEETFLLEDLAAQFPGHEVIVMPDEVQLAVIRPGAVGARTEPALMTLACAVLSCCASFDVSEIAGHAAAKDAGWRSREIAPFLYVWRCPEHAEAADA